LLGLEIEKGGIEMDKDCNWRFLTGGTMVVLSIIVAGVVAIDLPYFETTDAVRLAAKIYLVSCLFIVPLFVYLAIALVVIELVEGLYRAIRILIGKPLPPKPPIVIRPYRPRPPGCRFPGDYYSGEEE